MCYCAQATYLPSCASRCWLDVAEDLPWRLVVLIAGLAAARAADAVAAAIRSAPLAAPWPCTGYFVHPHLSRRS